MKKTITREEYNKKYLNGHLDESHINVRSNNLVNLECSECGAHCQLLPDPLRQNCYSKFQDSVCSVCLTPCGIRTRQRLDNG